MPKKPIDPTYLIAKDCLIEAKGDREKAARLLRKRAEADAGLWKALTEDAIDSTIWELLKHVAHQARSHKWEGAAGGMETEPRFSIYFYPLPNGTPLGRATREDIQHAIDQRGEAFNAAKRDIAWYTAILRRLKDKQTVEQVLSEDELKRMQERALNGAKVKAA